MNRPPSAACPGDSRSIRGFTLTEVLLALSISVIVLGFLFSSLGVLRRAQDGILGRAESEREPGYALRTLARSWESAADPFPDAWPVRSAPAGASNGQPLLGWFGPAPDFMDSGEWAQHELRWDQGILWTIAKPWPGAEGRWSPVTNRIASMEAPPAMSFHDGQDWCPAWPPPSNARPEIRLPRGIRLTWVSRSGPAAIEAALPCATVITSRVLRAAQAAPSAPASAP